MNKYIFIILSLVMFIVISAQYPVEIKVQSTCLLPNTSNALFATAGKCVKCHNTDTIAMLDNLGRDVSMVWDWQATIMANSAKDPFWKAKIQHELAEGFSHGAEIQQSCLKCHAPMGIFNAFHLGDSLYSMDDFYLDTVAKDGVSCNACHQLSWIGLTESFSGNLNYDTSQRLFGPVPNPFPHSMLDETGYDPFYGPHTATSELCAGCHTLIVNTMDTLGIISGNSHVEQATYHEWLNSDYSIQDETCQSCHIPQISDSIYLSSEPIQSIAKRSPYGLHHLVGGNWFMLNMLKNNKTQLDVNACDEQFDSTLSRTKQLLENRTASISLNYMERTTDSLIVELRLENKCGHKFPSGYPSRKAFIQFVVTNSIGDTLFYSGALDSDYRIINENTTWEPHYDYINSSSQVQIYEVVPVDQSGQPTTILNRAFENIKDNRLLPKGFTKNHQSYDTVAVIGSANTDVNFNVENNTEGSGTDVITFGVFLNNQLGELYIHTSLLYQSIAPKWLDELFNINDSLVLDFKTMYSLEDNKPIIISSDSLVVSPLNVSKLEQLKNGFYVRGNNLILNQIDKLESITIFNLQGSQVEHFMINNRFSFPLNISSGVYIVTLNNHEEVVYSSKLFLH